MGKRFFFKLAKLVHFSNMMIYFYILLL